MKSQKAEEHIRKCREEQSDFLDLGRCGLRGIPAEVFELAQLRRLNLGSRFYQDGEWVNTKNKGGYNQIRQLPADLIRLQNLEELSLEGNPIEAMGLLTQLPRLQRLNIGQVELKALDILKELPGLKALNIKGLQLRSLRRLAECGLPELTALEASDNGLQKIEALEAFPQLEHLNLSINRIREVEGLSRLKKLKSLYLGLNRIEEIKNLEELAGLEILSFGYLGGHYEEWRLEDYYRSNFIREIENLEGLPNLKKLDLSGNLIAEIKGLEAPTGLETLYLGHNQIENLGGVQHLGKLRALSLGYIVKDYNINFLLINNDLFSKYNPKSNLVEAMEGLEYFPELEYLSLDANELSQISGLNNNRKLEELHLSSNQISEIKNLDALAKLQSLDLDYNQISEIKNLGALAQLQSLYLSSNQISEIKNLSRLPSLHRLYIDKNRITHSQSLDEIPLLAELQISENRLSCFDAQLLARPNIMRLYMAENEFVNIPSEIANLENCLGDARAWFRDLERESAENFEVKLMLVGNGRVGKTSVLKRMFRNEFDAEEDSTHGIQLHSYDMPADFCSQPLRIHAWDFGGQEIYHATHRLFMQSRALYLALWDWETENRAFSMEHIAGDAVPFRNYELTYWLDHARSLSWQSPLMVVQNKIDQHERKWPKHLNELQQRYDIVNFHHISAATGDGISVLKSAMMEEFRKMPEAGMKMPAQWLRVKEKMLALKGENKTIAFSRYQNICEEEGLGASSAGALIRFLHHTGALFYQPHLFQNQVILDQEWALEGLYALFRRGPFYKQLKLSRGRTSLEALAWPWQQYDLNTRKVFLSMMESCEICFKTTEDEKDPEYIITEFLPDKKDEKVASFWEKAAENELFLKYQTNFFHPAFIRRFIARAGRLAKSYDHIWSNGIWITFEKAHALIEAFPDAHQIIIRVKGDPATAMMLLYLIHKSFKEIFYDPDSVEMEISLADREYLRYQEVKDGKIKGMKKVLSNSRRMVELEDVEFFSEVLEARSEAEVKRKLADIVPRPKVKRPDASAGQQEALSGEALQQLKEKLKGEVGKGLEKALETANGLLLDSELKNELIALQGSYADLKKFENTGQLGFEAYSLHSNQIRTRLIAITDRIESGDLDVEKALAYLYL